MGTHAGALSAAGEARRLGQALRTCRKARGVSATAAAEAAGVSRITWHRLEAGEPGVAWGSLLAAAQVLGLVVDLLPAQAEATDVAAAAGDGLPLRIRLQDYPQLRQLAWQVADDATELSPREALGVYERNWRHVQPAALDARERNLIAALRDVFGSEVLRV
ncbi:XRE family transcriptional regulator [Luteimonas aestuarii]|uniref:XRE family transcriptional regulator n=1 Tax=Luteimonas aestuarii TaxID=453837 RepID=A0A4R5TMF6_9GAMM|nr:helix-turn-helix transcriptional regulator [Luteimonas aestuarii]TDK18850.1 XRE family transcriptional regulator [Luteimonas aestuarii]